MWHIKPGYNSSANQYFIKEECSHCWVKFCGGGCAANNYSFNKDINKSYKIGCN